MSSILTLTRWSSPGRSIASASSASYLIILNLEIQNVILSKILNFIIGPIENIDSPIWQFEVVSGEHDLHSVYHHWKNIT